MKRKSPPSPGTGAPHDEEDTARAVQGQVFITATGNKNVVSEEHCATMPDNALLANAGHLDATVLSVPNDIDQQVAALTLKSLGVCLDGLTAEQKCYLASWSDGA